DESELDIPAFSLEAVGLELALQGAEGDDFADALASAGARLLFRMNLANGPKSPFVAAVAVGDGKQSQLLIVTRPANGAVTVESVESSDSPLARLAPSFAAVMERWA